MLVDAVAELPTDHTGYAATPRDLAFLELDERALRDLVTRHRPLGMSRHDYEFLVNELSRALVREGITEIDLRLQGSSAHFFSSPHKLMPYTIEAVANLMLDEKAVPPEYYLCDRILRCILDQWPEGENRPCSRPFDSLYVAQLTDQPSDYDLQIASYQMVQIVEDEIERRGFDPSQITVNNASYKFVRKQFSEAFFPHISMACGRVSERVGRPVTWALFDGGGPQEDASRPHLSSHFKGSDWVILRSVPSSEVH